MASEPDYERNTWNALSKFLGHAYFFFYASCLVITHWLQRRAVPGEQAEEEDWPRGM